MPEVRIEVKEIVLSKTITDYRKNFIWNVKILADIFQCFFFLCKPSFFKTAAHLRCIDSNSLRLLVIEIDDQASITVASGRV